MWFRILLFFILIAAIIYGVGYFLLPVIKYWFKTAQQKRNEMDKKLNEMDKKVDEEIKKDKKSVKNKMK